MRNVISAELYKIRQYGLLWCAWILAAAAGFYYSIYDYKVFQLYDRLELFAFPTLGRDMLCLMTAIMTGYIIGMDFSQRTILNVISAGIGRKDYFFGRLAVSLLLVLFLYATATLTFAVGRLCIHPIEQVRPELTLFWAKWAVCMVCVILQLWSYAAVINMACYFVKGQLAAMAIGLGLVFAELIFGQIADMYEIASVIRIFDFAPVRVLGDVFEKYAMYDRILTFDFLKYGILAVCIIVSASAAGFIKFRYFPGNDAI